MVTNDLTKIEIRPFQPEDQSATRHLILSGLADHWGTQDPTLNPDLIDIAYSYKEAIFLVAVQGKMVVGCGALIAEAEQQGCGRIVRMSVRRQFRRQGIGQRLLHRLLYTAKRQGFHKIVLETTSSWTEAINFYQSNGFQITGQVDGDTHFVKNLDR